MPYSTLDPHETRLVARMIRKLRAESENDEVLLANLNQPEFGGDGEGAGAHDLDQLDILFRKLEI